MRIACLHTVDSNAAVFEAARPPGASLRHVVRADLLSVAEGAGGLTPAIRDETRALLAGLAAEADAVLLTCSTLGPSADGLALRVDAALAAATATAPGPRLVLYAVATTEAPTRALFAVHGADFEMRLVPDAWDAFRAGDLPGYHARVAEAADAGFAEGYATVALAQASMAGAAALCRRGLPLTSPAAALAALLSRPGTPRG
ncbi:Asp/Glu racemase [Roseomonas hellenica]|uniref:Asp/Glu racemase n=1 Tax=Plastoroseomonas hellenica TaxID=2687306 RepID=A0ABS5F305_9PROT|nr:Asp/Glu racemase [Plastoroseomonas hellenica]